MTRAVAALCVLAAGWGLIFWLDPWADAAITDVPVYRGYAESMAGGALPYRDFAFEYPPLAAPVMALPALVGTDEDVYRVAFGLLMLLAAAGLVLLAGALAARSGGNPGRAMLAAGVAPLLTGAMIRTHFDLVPVLLMLGALLLLARERPRAGLALLGVAAGVKLFPLVAVPVVIAWLLARQEGRAAAEGMVALVVVLALTVAAGVALSADGAADAVRYHSERPLQVESTPALAALALDGAGAGAARVVHSHGSHGVVHPAAGALELTSAALVLVAALALAAAAARRPGTRELLLASLAAVTAFAALGKVLSPQFLVWVVPLVALALAWRLHALALAGAAAIALTLAEFPSRYYDVVDREPAALALVGLRNGLLLLALGLAARELGRQPEGAAISPRRAAAAAGSP